MPRKPRNWLDAILSRSPVQPFFHWRAAAKLTVLAYHGIRSPERFEKQLDYLIRRTHPISLDELLAGVRGQSGLPRRAVLVTFDDGDRSIFETALPMLRDRGIPAVVFVVAGWLDRSVPPWWAEAVELAEKGGKAAGFEVRSGHELVRELKRVPDEARLEALRQLRQTAVGPAVPRPHLRREELRMMESAGLAIGNHTLTHPCLPRCDDAKVLEELSESHAILAQALGHQPLSFAYPNGDVDERAVEQLARLAYGAAFTFDHRLSPRPPRDRFRISRLRVNADSTLDRFSIIVSGLHPALHQARGRR